MTLEGTGLTAPAGRPRIDPDHLIKGTEASRAERERLIRATLVDLVETVRAVLGGDRGAAVCSLIDIRGQLDRVAARARLMDMRLCPSAWSGAQQAAMSHALGLSENADKWGEVAASLLTLVERDLGKLGGVANVEGVEG
jgi:hypothetical protein